MSNFKEIYNQKYKECFNQYYNENKISKRDFIKKSSDLYAEFKKLENEENLKKMNHFKSVNKSCECLICLNDVQECDQLECGHYVHLSCLKQYQESGNKLFYDCPLCKHELSNIKPEFNLDKNNLKYTIEFVNGTFQVHVYNNKSKYWILPNKSHKEFAKEILSYCK